MPRELLITPFCLEQNWPVAVSWVHGRDVEDDHLWSFPICIPMGCNPEQVESVLGYTLGYLVRVKPDWEEMLNDKIRPMLDRIRGAIDAREN